ncbi:hypothetical protein [Mariniblastus fucicola]|uniref:SnoaL-like domain-containing protein n=1 Tax=Mariniblastus fucicola TaxID=980251 RepID=A0A5B9PCA2_9BACT|nr:hypothetical protein [Mariniblastus fucicola]QEG22795.1 hypothetical protein MFFC18_26790 [Mariniblastus fucicola]
MLEWFTESAFFPSCIGILLTIAFIGLAVSSGEMLMMKIGLGIAVLTALLITTEVMIVTDREQVENSLYDMASAMGKNDLDRVFSYLDSDELIQRAKHHLRDATCHSCNITAINEVTVDDDGQSATADFVAFASASNASFPSPTPVQRRVKLFFKKKSDKWKIVDFEAKDPRAGLSL